MGQELTTADVIFEKLGGVSAVAAITNSRYRTAHNWKAAGCFPPKTYVVLTTALRSRGYSAPPKLWGMAIHEAAQ